MRRFAQFLLVLGASLAVQASELEQSAFDLDAYLETYCIDCHGPEKEKGDRRWDTFHLPIADTETLIQAQEILDILNLAEMPPPEEDRQPTDEENRQAIVFLTQTLEARYAELESTDRQTVFRRLNRREYRNTIRDLLKIDTTAFDPTQSFPRDETDHHLDTIGDRLVTSGYLLDRYLEAADRVIEKVFALEERPEPKTYFFTDDFRQQPELDGALEDWGNFEFIALYETPLSVRHEGAYAKINGFEAGVPHDGFYQVRVNAIAKNRSHNHLHRRVSTNPNEPIRLGIVTGNQRFGDLSRPQPIEPELASFDLQDEVLEWREATVWLDAGDTPRFTYPNGMLGLRGNFRPIADALSADPNFDLENIDFSDRRLIAMQHGKLPHIQIHDVEITGPLYEHWPPASQRNLLGARGYAPERASQLIADFAERAFRRPATIGETDELIRFLKRRERETGDSFQAYKDVLKRVLCSPSFLYLEEPSNTDGKLDAYALASRLSYFLWSSMPDAQLLKAARTGAIHNPNTIRQELRRMLADPKGEAFLNSFLNTCLTLEDLGTQPPDRKLFSVFYERGLQSDMREETRLFVQHLLDANLPLSQFVEADYSFLNESLAKLYGQENVSGTEFRKTPLTDPRRAGILGHASILTVSANGVDTSPVTRGVWMLENLLGTPPSPPPPDVEPFDPDTRGSSTIREQLEKHRENPTCYDCHRKIDPMGFAFESFDAIGRWREQYPKGADVDPSGALADGTRYDGIVAFRAAMLDRTPQIARSFATKLLAYASGRRMEPGDRPHIDALVEELERKGYGFYDLVELIALNPIFQDA